MLMAFFTFADAKVVAPPIVNKHPHTVPNLKKAKNMYKG